MPKNEHTLKYFRRYSKFYLKGLSKEMFLFVGELKQLIQLVCQEF